MALQPGDRLEHFEIVAQIGAGGMGEVYKAVDTRLGRTVAIKVARDVFTARFQNEARAVAALNHPNICQLFDVGPNYLVMEYVEGAPIKGPMDVAKAVHYGRQILDALAHAHSKNLTHRDLKPANVLLTKQGIKLLDFGIAKRTAPTAEGDETLTEALTAQGEILGTLQYMSPEQLQAKPVTPRSDLFSFGCVLHELVSGKRAFTGDSAASVIARILEREPEPLELDPPLRRILDRCLAKDPDARFQSATDLNAALQWAMAPQAPAAAPPPPPPPPSRLPWVIAAVCAVVAIGATAVAWRGTAKKDAAAFHYEITQPGPGVSNSFPVISRDGARIAYSHPDPRQPSIVLRRLGSLEAVTVATGGSGAPSFSPDSQHLMFLKQGKLYRTAVEGGSPTFLADYGRAGTPFVVWPDGGHMIYPTNQSLYKVAENGGKPELFIEPDPARNEAFAGYPRLLPDGRRLTYLTTRLGESTDGVLNVASVDQQNPRERHPILEGRSTDSLVAAAPNGDWWMLTLDGNSLVARKVDRDNLKPRGPATVIVPSMTAAGGRIPADISSNGTLVYQAGSFDEVLTLFERSGRRQAAGPVRSYRTLSLSPDGSRVVADVSTRGRAGFSPDLWIQDLDRGTFTRFTSSSRAAWPVWAPDGGQIAWSLRGQEQVAVRDATGAGTETIVPAKGFPLSWVAGGRLMLTRRFVKGNWHLFVADLETKTETLAAGADDGRLSADGKWLAYTSIESGVSEVYVTTYPPGGGKWQISTNGGRFPRWRADSGELYYLGPKDMLTAVPLRISGTRLEPGTPVSLFTAEGITGYEPMPSGQRFVALAKPEDAPPATIGVILNWHALLPRD